MSIYLYILSQQKMATNIDPLWLWEKCPMRTIYVLRSGGNYFIDGIYWGDDEEGVILYLRAKSVSPDDITKALAQVAQTGEYLIQQEE
jgi:hypothetical protein